MPAPPAHPWFNFYEPSKILLQLLIESVRCFARCHLIRQKKIFKVSFKVSFNSLFIVFQSLIFQHTFQEIPFETIGLFFKTLEPLWKKVLTSFLKTAKLPSNPQKSADSPLLDLFSIRFRCQQSMLMWYWQTWKISEILSESIKKHCRFV